MISAWAVGMTAMTAHDIKIQCDSCAIRHKAICAALSEGELHELNRLARRRLVPAGQTIAGDDDVIFANIVSGVVKLTRTLADGRQQIVGLQFPPDFLGRIYTDNTPYFAEAATDVELCSFPRAGFEVLLKRFPDLEHRLLEKTLDELDAARDWMVLLGRKTAQEKVASLLLLIARRSRDIGCHHSQTLASIHFRLPLTRADIADYLGLTLETVSRQMTRLKMQGTIELFDNRDIVIPDIGALEEAAEQR